MIIGKHFKDIEVHDEEIAFCFKNMIKEIRNIYLSFIKENPSDMELMEKIQGLSRLCIGKFDYLLCSNLLNYIRTIYLTNYLLISRKFFFSTASLTILERVPKLKGFSI